nr:hypothetical protein Saspl_047305 [Ipomoea trifida]
MRLLSLSCCLCLHSHTRSDNEVSPLWLEENEFLSKACLWEKVLLSSKELLFSESRIRILLERPSLSELGQRSKAYAVEADIRLLAFYLHLPDRKEFALFGMNSQRLDPRTSLVEWRLFLSKNFSVELKKKSLSSFGLLLAKRGGYPHVSQSDVHFLDPLSTFNYLLSLVWNHHHYTFILGLADGLASLPSRLECSLPAEDRNVRRRSVLETAAAARGVNDRTCCNLGITRQLFRSIGIGGHSTILLGGGLFARVTDPAIICIAISSSVDAPEYDRDGKRKTFFSGELSLVKPKTPQDKFRKGSLMLEGASPLSDRSASSRKSKEVITDEPHAGKLARVVLAGLPEGDRSTSFPIALGLCLDLLCAKSKGLVPIEIPLGLIPRLMTKGESAWRKVKIGGSRENSLLGYSEGPKGSSAQLPTPPGIALSEPSQEWPTVYLYQKKEEKLGHVSRERRLLSGQQSSTSSRLLYDGLPCFLGSARSYTLRPSK